MKRNHNKYTLEDMEAIIKPRHGKIISKEYSHEGMVWECEKGHTEES